MNETLLKSFQHGNNQCCEKTPEYEITYKNNETWSVCSSCCNLDIWSRHIKSKNEIKTKERSS